MQSSIPGATAFQNLFPDFKISTGYELAESAITGHCEIYKQRTDGENEYAIGEIGVVLIPKDTAPTNAMVNEAIQQARAAALSTMEQLLAVAASFPVPPTEELYAPPNMPVPPERENQLCDADNHLPPIQGDDAEPAADAEQGETAPTGPDPVLDSNAPVTEKASALLEKVPFSAELFPASTIKTADEANAEAPAQIRETAPPPSDVAGNAPLLLPPSELATEPAVPPPSDISGENDDGLDGARNTVITIIGKSNECYNWAAGKIAAEHPEAIINMFQRYGNGKYTGPQTDQMAAIEALYPEALRRMQGVAA